jgi:mediator of RNA polymerase II transcription subunit 18, fungi type
MHELFLTAHVPNEDIDRSLRVLQGYCSMNPVSLLRRRLVWEGPRSRQLKGIDPAFIARQGPKAPFWRSLHEQLTRQSYVITLIYDIDREQFGKGEVSSGQEGLGNLEADGS